MLNDSTNIPAIRVTYDEKRCAYWVKGDGFDFWLHFTDDEDGAYLECDCITRWYQDVGLDRPDSIIFEVKGVPSVDWVETAVLRELAECTFLLSRDEGDAILEWMEPLLRDSDD
jgi:hypothetical protein